MEAEKAVLVARLAAAAADSVTLSQRCAELTQQLEEQQMVADKQHEVYTVRTGKVGAAATAGWLSAACAVPFAEHASASCSPSLLIIALPQPVSRWAVKESKP